MPLQKQGGIAPVTGVLQWMTISSSEGKGKRSGGVALYVRECFDIVELGVGNEYGQRSGGRSARWTSW